VVDDMPADVATLADAAPLYEELEGWCRPISAARRLADLPPQARAYLDRIQDLVGTPIAYVSVGSRRDQIIST
jgi:adenylosuccinate synthase